MSFKDNGAICTLNTKSQKLEHNFPYHGSKISATESDVSIRIEKAWTVIDRLSIMWTSDFSDKIKRKLFIAVAVPVLLYGYTTWTLNKRLEKKLYMIYTRIQQNTATNL